jgi:type I restriction enzyme S subunit
MVLRTDDVIMSTVRPHLQAFAYYGADAGNVVASTGFAVLRAKEGTDPYFLLCTLLSNDVAKQIDRLAVGSNYPAINGSDVRRLLVPRMAPGDQRRIARVLGAMDDAIDRAESLIEKHQQIKAGLMRDLFTRGALPNGQLRPTRAEAPQAYRELAGVWLPDGWQYERLDDLATRGSGHTPNKNVPEYWNGGIKWVSLADSHRLDSLYISDIELTISHRGIQNSSAVLLDLPRFHGQFYDSRDSSLKSAGAGLSTGPACGQLAAPSCA